MNEKEPDLPKTTDQGEKAPLQQYYEWKHAGKPVEIMIHRRVLKEILTQAEIGLTGESKKEVGGVFFGSKLSLPDNKFKIFIEAAEPVIDENATAIEFGFTAKEKWRLVSLQGEKYPKWEQVGWYHTHIDPNAIFLSPADKEFCRTDFHEPYHVALVIQANQKHAGFFVWENKQMVGTPQTFSMENEATQEVASEQQKNPEATVRKLKTEMIAYRQSLEQTIPQTSEGEWTLTEQEAYFIRDNLARGVGRLAGKTLKIPSETTESVLDELFPQTLLEENKRLKQKLAQKEAEIQKLSIDPIYYLLGLKPRSELSKNPVTNLMSAVRDVDEARSNRKMVQESDINSILGPRPSNKKDGQTYEYKAIKLRQALDKQTVEKEAKIEEIITSLSQKYGIELIDPSPAAKYSPKYHEIMSQERNSDIPRGSILRTKIRGWRDAKTGELKQKAFVVLAE